MAAIYKAKRENSGEYNPANYLILNFQSPEFQENKNKLFKGKKRIVKSLITKFQIVLCPLNFCNKHHLIKTNFILLT